VLSLKAEDPESASWKQDAKGLESYLAQEKPWLDPELRFSDIASSMNWTESRLSLVIKHGMKTNFQSLLNAYRLAEFERLVHDMDSRSRDILTLAFDAGFGSKASFYRVFKEAHGTTPTQYRDSILRSLPRQASHLSR